VILDGNDENTGISELYAFRQSWGGEPVGSVDMSGGFHTIRFEHPGGNADTIDLFFDGNQVIDDFPMNAASSNSAARFFAGNGGARQREPGHEQCTQRSFGRRPAGHTRVSDTCEPNEQYDG